MANTPRHQQIRNLISTDRFLPARRTDGIFWVTDDHEIDELHQKLWEGRDPRDKDSYSNFYDAVGSVFIRGTLIAQGRIRKLNRRYYIKDPEIWNEEAVDYRGQDTKTYWLCQLCGSEYEYPKPNQLVACWTCSELIGLWTQWPNYWKED